MAEAPSYGQTIYEYADDCHGAEDYRKVAEFIHKGICAEPAEQNIEQLETEPETQTPPEQNIESEPQLEEQLQTQPEPETRPEEETKAPIVPPLEIRPISQPGIKPYNELTSYTANQSTPESKQPASE